MKAKLIMTCDSKERQIWIGCISPEMKFVTKDAMVVAPPDMLKYPYPFSKYLQVGLIETMDLLKGIRDFRKMFVIRDYKKKICV